MLYNILVLLTCLLFGLFNVEVLAQESQASAPPSLSTLGLSSEELSWLAENSVVDFFLDADSPPYQFLHNGEPVGITADLLEVIEKRLGIQIRKNSLPSDKLAKGVMSSEIPMFGVWPEQSFKKEIAYLKTNNIVNGYLSLFGRESDRTSNNIDEIENKNIGVVKGLNEHIISNLGKKNKIVRLDKEDRIGALLSKQIDLYLVYREVGRFSLKQNMTRGIEEKYTFPDTHNGVIYVHKSEPLLLSILNKVINDISAKELPAILEKWYGIDELPAPIHLTEKEQAWLAAHPKIRVMNEPDYAPYDFQIKGEPMGYSIDYVELLAKRLGIEIEFVQASFSGLIDKAKRSEIDLIHSVFQYPQERETFLNFTQPYKNSVMVIIIRKEEGLVSNIEDLNGRKVAVIKGSATSTMLKEKFPNMIAIEFDGYESALKAVAFGQADATVNELPVAGYLIRKLLLSNLKVSSEIKPLWENKFQYHLAVRKDWPELIPILEKAMDSISYSELAKLDNHWLQVTKERLPSLQTSSSQLDRPFEWKKVAAAGMILFLIISVTLILFRLLVNSKKDPLAYEFASTGGKKIAVMLNSLLIVIALFLAFWALNNVRENVEDDIRNSLKTVVMTTMEAMNIWVDDHKNKLNSIAANKRIIELTSLQLAQFRHGNALEATPALNELRDIFTEIKSHTKHEGFFIIAPDGTNIGSMRDTNLGRINLIRKQRPELLQRVFLGESIFIPPIISDISEPNSANVSGHEKPPTMFFASPIRDNKGRVIAALTERFNPHGDFSRINSLGRIGKTGETYSFDKQGQLLSESRFLNDLIKVGLIQNQAQSILSIELRDPGGNLLEGFNNQYPIKDRPLTLMAASATQGETSYNIKGYRDYRGVTVLGAWIWDKSLGFGMTSEIDIEEALEAYYSARITVIAVLVVMVVVSIALTLLSMVLGSRANKALQHSRDQLEERVLQRTEELRHSEERFDLAMRGANDGLWDWNYLTNEVYYSERWMSMLGYNSEELEGSLDTWRKLIHPEDMIKTLELIEACVNGDRDDFNIEFRMRHKDGTWVPILSRAYVVRDPVKHVPIRFVGTNIDLTQQKQTEQELHHILTDLNEQRYVLDQHAIVAVTDLRGTITYANQKFEEVSGYSSDELIGQNHRILNSQTHNREFWRGMYRTISTGGVWNHEICNQAKDGHLYWVDTTISAFTGEDGKPRAYVAIRTDITQRKYYEKELKEAKYHAEGANKAKSEFLASMSHEIRTPMNGVLGMLGLLLNNELTTEQSQRVLIAQNSAKSLLSLINDILDFSKVEAGKLELEELDFDVRKLLEEISKTMVFRADEKGIELLLDVSGVEHSMIIGDPSRIRQIVINLIGNAIKFTEKGEVIISATLKEHDTEQLKLVCSIRDTGIGIPETLMPDLFNSFTQVDSSTTRQYGGSGLGLSISKKLCELMNGSIQATSEPGNGSCFTFEVLVRPSKQSIKVVPRVDITQLKVLIVDDNKTNRGIFRHQLEYWGASVTEAESAQRAIEQCKRHADNLFDIALIDMNMPEMDGIALTKAIRHDSQFNTLKLIMMTSSYEQESSEKMHDIGLNGYFSKPVSTSDLFDALALVSYQLPQKDPGALITKNYLDSLERKREGPAKPNIPNWLAETRILLVEDNQINQLVVQGMLKEWTLDCDLANNGLEAITSLRNAPDDAPYTLVLMDCQMPELDGYDATRNIREGKSGERYLKTPIIAITANAMKGDKEKCLDAGMNDFLTKPLESITLLNTLKKWLSITPSVSSKEKNTSAEQALNNENSIQQKQSLVTSLKIPLRLNTIDFINKKPGVADSPSTFLKALSLYVKQAQLFLEKLGAYVQNNEYGQALPLIHSIKGTSGNLGMYSVYEFAKTLEKDVVEKSNLDSQILNSFCDLIQLSMADAKAIIEANIEVEQALPTRKYVEIKRDLIKRLEKSELVSESLVLEFKSSASKVGMKTLTLPVIEAIDTFDYDIALSILLNQAD